MAGSTGDIDITPEGFEALWAFGDNQYPVADFKGLGKAIMDVSNLPSGPSPAGGAFRAAAIDSAAKNSTYLDNVNYGFATFKDGAQKMAESYDAANQQMAWNMEDVTTRTGEPAS